jgi:hypothetical protein
LFLDAKVSKIFGFSKLFKQLRNPKPKVVPHKVDKGSEQKGNENPKVGFREFLFLVVRLIQSKNATDKGVHHAPKIDDEKSNVRHS